MNAWMYLIVGAMCEVVFAFTAEKADGYTKFMPTLATAVVGIISIWMVSMAMRSLPVGTAYAVWTALGAAFTVMVGIAFFHEPISVGRIFFLGMIIFGAVGLHLVSAPK